MGKITKTLPINILGFIVDSSTMFMLGNFAALSVDLQIYLSSIKSAKFKSTVEPGDQLLIKAELANFKLGTCKIKSQIYVDNKLITECELLASVVNRYE